MATVYKRIKTHKTFADAISKGRRYVFIDTRLCPKAGDIITFEILDKGKKIIHDISRREFVLVDVDNPPQVHESVCICTIREV